MLKSCTIFPYSDMKKYFTVFGRKVRVNRILVISGSLISRSNFAKMRWNALVACPVISRAASLKPLNMSNNSPIHPWLLGITYGTTSRTKARLQMGSYFRRTLLQPAVRWAYCVCHSVFVLRRMLFFFPSPLKVSSAILCVVSH